MARAGSSWATATATGVSYALGTWPPTVTLNPAAFNPAPVLDAGNFAGLPDQGLPAGAVAFSNGSTLVADAANFTFDNTANRLGLGTAAPAAPLHVVSADNTAATDSTRFVAQNGTAGVATGCGPRAAGHGLRATGCGSNNTLTLDGQGGGAVLLQASGGAGRVGIGTAAPNPGLQLASSIRLPFRTVEQTAGAYVAVVVNDADHTVRSGTPGGVTGVARFSFYLPDPDGRAGRVVALLNYGLTPAFLHSEPNNATASLYDDGGGTNVTQAAARSRLTLQSDGRTWIVLSRWK